MEPSGGETGNQSWDIPGGGVILALVWKRDLGRVTEANQAVGNLSYEVFENHHEDFNMASVEER
jgi:hypothetical protein